MARSTKRVLARQEVARTGKTSNHRTAKSSAQAKRGATNNSGLIRDILAVFVLVGAVGLSCALFSYHPQNAHSARVENLIGPLGHEVAANLFGLVGLCAYLAPVAMFYTSMALFIRGRAHRRGRQIIGLIGLALSGSVLAHLLVGRTSMLAYPPGGSLGAVLGESLRSVLSTVGSVLAMFAAAAGALIVATDAAFTRLCVAVGSGLRSGAIAAWAATYAFGKNQLARLKERHAERQREKAEEEAAFAQSLADAEESEEHHCSDLDDHHQDQQQTESANAEVSDDEALAEEAALVAEEASRLAREAEERRLKEMAQQKARDAALRAARRARNAPVEDPAWALPGDNSQEELDESATSTAVAANVATAPDSVAASKPIEEKTRPQPVIALPSSPGTSLLSSPPFLAPPSDNLEPEPSSAQAATVGTLLPLIVEPKTPPKPSKPDKKDPFAFEEKTEFSLPPLSLLDTKESKTRVLDKNVFFSTAEKLREKLASFGIDGVVKEIRPGPVVTMYEFEPAPGIKISKIAGLADDLAMAMEALKVRIVAPIPGKGVVGIEVPNKERETVYFHEIVEQDAFTKSSSKLAMAVGKNIEGLPYVTDLVKMPHLLIAGTTGSGKSVTVNAMIMSILFKSTPQEVRMIMVDPKVTELSIYEGIPHLLLPVVTDARKAALALRWAVEEMERRYQLLADAGVRNIAGYNKWVERMDGAGSPSPKEASAKTKSSEVSTVHQLRIIDLEEGQSEEEGQEVVAGGNASMPGVPVPNLNDDPDTAITAAPGATQDASATLLVDADKLDQAEPQAAKPEPLQKLPYIVIIIDEVADLMMVASREVETYVARLAQMARAAGIHLMIATQRPSTDVITGVIKANFPSRISFQLRSKPDSMTILGTVGAEALLGMGDMLVLPPTSAHLERVHGAYVSDAEIQRVVSHLKSQGKPVYDESILRPRDDENEDGESSSMPEEYNDEMYDQCLALVSEMRQVSVSMLQRRLRLGYNRAARIIERMEREGVVGPANGSKPRDVLIRPVGEMHKEVNL